MRLKKTLAEITSKLEYIGKGRHRCAYKTKSGRYVIKVPHYDKDEQDEPDSGFGDGGELANIREAEDYLHRHPQDEVKYAACRIVNVEGVSLLMMEYVEEPRSSNLPDWVHQIDCGQVGYNHKGELVAYDWS